MRVRSTPLQVYSTPAIFSSNDQRKNFAPMRIRTTLLVVELRFNSMRPLIAAVGLIIKAKGQIAARRSLGDTGPSREGTQPALQDQQGPFQSKAILLDV